MSNDSKIDHIFLSLYSIKCLSWSPLPLNIESEKDQIPPGEPQDQKKHDHQPFSSGSFLINLPRKNTIIRDFITEGGTSKRGIRHQKEDHSIYFFLINDETLKPCKILKSKGNEIWRRKRDRTGADPIADSREPLGIGRGFGVDEKARLLASIAEGSEGVVPVLASSAFPISFSAFSHLRNLPFFDFGSCGRARKLGFIDGNRGMKKGRRESPRGWIEVSSHGTKLPSPEIKREIFKYVLKVFFDF